MAFLNEQEKSRLTEQIRTAEAGTSGEIVTVITARSDDYTYIPLLWATLISLAVPGIWFLLAQLNQRGWTGDATHAPELHSVYLMQVALFFLLAMLVQWEPLRMRLIPGTVKRQRAAANARSQFLAQHVHWTEHRAGVLIFVSVAEHYVEILVDRALADIVTDDYWQQTVEHFVTEVRSGNTAQGFEQAIDDCRSVLWEHYPAQRQDAKSLPDHLIEV